MFFDPILKFIHSKYYFNVVIGDSFKNNRFSCIDNSYSSLVNNNNLYNFSNIWLCIIENIEISTIVGSSLLNYGYSFRLYYYY